MKNSILTNGNMVLAIVFLIVISCSTPVTYDVVIENVGLFDGQRDHGKVYIAINADTVAKISQEKIPADSIIDGTGKYVIPGLVNAHVHANDKEDLKKGYPLGILYLLNMHTGLEDREVNWKKMTQDSIGYSILYGSGHAATVPNGHPTQFSPEMETINDSTTIEDWVDRRIAKGVDYIKLIHVTRGFLGESVPSSLSYEQISQLITYSHKKGYKVVVHATSFEEMMEIAKFKPDGFVHMPDYKDLFPVVDNYFEELKKSGAFVITTGGIALKPLDGQPPFFVDWINQNFLNSEERAEIIRSYHENNIPIVAGTDAQDGQMDFGEDYFLELDLYKMAGLSNLEILKSATGNAAKAFGLPIGQVKEGESATFVVLNENPLEDISALRNISEVWKNGIALSNK